MYIESINIGTKQTFQIGKHSYETGFVKEPVTGPVNITLERVGNDYIHETKIHGTPDQAVYIYGGIDYAWWAQKLERELPPGIFGENMTIADLESGPFYIGDRLLMGNVILEVTSPRVPCFKLAKRMKDPTFVKQFRKAQRPGLYCRVIQPGLVSAGDSVTIEPFNGTTITIQKMFDIFFTSPPIKEEIETILKAPIAGFARDAFETKLRDDSIIQDQNKKLDDIAELVSVV